MKLVQNPKEFLDDFISSIQKAKESIYIQSMNFESGKVMTKLEKALVDALKRGVKVYINYDWISQKFAHGKLPLLPTISKTKRIYKSTLHKKNNEMITRLVLSGAKFTKTNIPSVLFSAVAPMGRNHIKMYIVDKKVAWIGGVNLFDEAFENIDLMVRISDRKLIGELIYQFLKVNKKELFTDYKKQCDNNYTIYIDSGKKGKSIIYAEAVELIQKSEKSILFMSQFVPDGQLLEQLIKASEKGIKIDIITSPIPNKNTSFIEKLALLAFKGRIKKHKNIKLTHLPKYVHAKLLLIDNKVAFWGSHNLTYAGVLLGTSEIMIKTTDGNVLEQIKKFIDAYRID